MQNFGGISRYFYELIKHSRSNSKVDAQLGILACSNEYLKEDEKINGFLKVNPELGLKAYRPLKMVNEAYSNYMLQSKKLDLFHPTFYDTYYLNKSTKPFVLTVYDLINEKYPEYFKNNEGFIENKRKLINKATSVIAISENTKKDLIEYFNVDEKKIYVSYLAESLSEVTSKEVDNLPENYILFTGKRGGYKNFERLYNALKPLLLKHPELYLVCAGGGGFSKEETARFAEDKLDSKVKHFAFQTNEELKYFYEHAVCFVFPSLYEGFGIPVLESFASGCLTLLSNSSSLIEIGRSGALYFDPLSESSIANTLTKALELNFPKKPSLKLIEQANIELSNFSWAKTFDRTCEIYEKSLR